MRQTLSTISRFACTGPSRSVPGTAWPAVYIPRAGRPTTPVSGCCFGGQDRPTGDDRTAECDLRGRLPRVQLRVPAGGAARTNALDALCSSDRKQEVNFILDRTSGPDTERVKRIVRAAPGRNP